MWFMAESFRLLRLTLWLLIDGGCAEDEFFQGDASCSEGGSEGVFSFLCSAFFRGSVFAPCFDDVFYVVVEFGTESLGGYGDEGVVFAVDDAADFALVFGRGLLRSWFDVAGECPKEGGSYADYGDEECDYECPFLLAGHDASFLDLVRFWPVGGAEVVG